MMSENLNLENHQFMSIEAVIKFCKMKNTASLSLANTKITTD